MEPPISLTISSRRHKSHCPIVGVCFDLKKIRQLVSRVMVTDHQTSDFEIHVTAVKECGQRSPLSELLQKELERQFSLEIQRTKSLKDSEALAARWRAALEIKDVAGPLWALLTHPRCTPELQQRIYGDIHMLQHQVGAGDRADLAQLRHLQDERSKLKEALAQQQQKISELHHQHARELEQLRTELALARENGLRQEQAAARYLGEAAELQQMLEQQGASIPLSRRLQQSEARYTALRARTGELENQVERLHRENRQLAQIALRPHSCNTSAESEVCPQDPALNGRSVLCVGGRTGNARQYRDLVEGLGGRFLHHDGGLEASIAQLEGSISAADAVICQAGCISHNAYWRVKEYCKRTGKPCLYLKTTGLSSFVRGLEHLANRDTETHVSPERIV